MDFILNEKRLAHLLGISRREARQLLNRRGFPSVKVTKNHSVITRPRLINWLNDWGDNDAAPLES